MKQPAFGKKLTEIRTAKGITQDELAEKCKISVRTIQRIESGVVKPRAFTIKAISATLEFDFFEASNYTREDVKINRHSNLKWFSSLLWHFKDLFNLKTHTMKKLTILSMITCLILVGLLSITNNLKAQKFKSTDHSNFLESNSRGIIYFFPKGELKLTFNVKDTADYWLKKDLIQEYKNNIYLNGSFVGNVIKGDTVIYRKGNIYRKGKIIIKSAYSEYTSSYGPNIHYFTPTPITSATVQTDTEYLDFGENTIREHKYKIYLNDVFQIEVQAGDSVVYRNGKVNLLNENVEREWWYPYLIKHGFEMDRSKFNRIMITKKRTEDLCENIKVAFYEADSAIFIIEAPTAIINKTNTSFKFSNGKNYRYYKNGDTEKGSFELLSLEK